MGGFNSQCDQPLIGTAERLHQRAVKHEIPLFWAKK
jgi:hypothetical protein